MSAQPISMTTERNGVIQIISKDEKNYYIVDDVMDLVGVSKPKAYKIIRSLRTELIASGKLISEYPAGRIPKKYFNLRCGLDI